MPLPVPPDLTQILTTPELQVIIDQYDPVALGELLSFGLVNRYKPITPYLTGIGEVLYPEFDTNRPPTPLSAANRERCLVALLASRARRLELAIHIYMALANRVLPAELAHILVAASVYTGVDTVGNAFGIMQITLTCLKGMADTHTAQPENVLRQLAVAIPG